MLAAGAKAAVNGETAAVAPPPKRRRTSSPCVLCPPSKSTGKPLYHQPGNCPTLKAQKKTAREAQQASRPQAAAAQSEPAVQATAEELAAYVEAKEILVDLVGEVVYEDPATIANFPILMELVALFGGDPSSCHMLQPRTRPPPPLNLEAELTAGWCESIGITALSKPCTLQLVSQPLVQHIRSPNAKPGTPRLKIRCGHTTYAFVGERY